MNKTKYKNKVSILQNMDSELYNKLSLALDNAPYGVTRTDLINSMLTHCLSLEEETIIKILNEYKND